MTKLTRLTFLFTLINLGLFGWLVAQSGRVAAQDTVPVLRGRALEIVDEQGRVRASITRYPSSGATFDDVVILRLHDRAGRPTVKLATHETSSGATGAGLGLLGDSDSTQAFIGADGPGAKVELKNADGRRHQLQP